MMGFRRSPSACRRVGDLFSDRSLSSRFANLAKHHLKGVENVYTQHTPLVVNTLEQLVKGKLPNMDYPSVSGANTSPGAVRVGAIVLRAVHQRSSTRDCCSLTSAVCRSRRHGLWWRSLWAARPMKRRARWRS